MIIRAGHSVYHYEARETTFAATKELYHRTDAALDLLGREDIMCSVSASLRTDVAALETQGLGVIFIAKVIHLRGGWPRNR